MMMIAPIIFYLYIVQNSGLQLQRGEKQRVEIILAKNYFQGHSLMN